MPPRNEHTEIAGEVFTFKILRCDPSRDEKTYFSSFAVAARNGMTVLEALFRIQEEQDPSLVFRYSCRGAVCGSCAMTINGRPDLACRVQLARLKSREVLLEPLPNLEILKDLIVDLEPFWQAYRTVEPWLMPGSRENNGEHPVSEKNRAQIDQYVNCILCACCYGACPAVSRDQDYLGPAALAKLFRFVRDSRDRREWKTAFARVDSERGAWGCDTIFRCVDACPKQVRPADGIEALRRRMVLSRCGLGKKGGAESEPQ